jgi:acyl-CoA synthetase (AMP-forming)/AMP-acid ligase II
MINPIKYLISNAKLVPEKPVIVSTELTVSFKECLERVQHLAIKFRKLGIKPGQTVVVISYDKTLEWLVTLALIHEGVVTLSHRYTKLPEGVNPDLIFCDKEPDKFLFKSKHQVFDKNLFMKNENIKDIIPQDYKSENSLFRLALSSGTTGEPKCAPFTIKNVQDRFYIFNKFKSTICLTGGISDFLCALSQTCREASYYDTISNECTAKLIIKYHIEHLFGSPQQLAQLIEFVKDQKISITSLKAVTTWGSKASPVLLDDIKICLCKNVINFYGSTELGLLSENNLKNSTKITSVGFPEAVNEVEIVDELGNVLKNEEEGLIRAKTNTMVNEYYNDETSTKQCFKDGWFYSGDIGHLTNKGELYVTGRNDERINLDGVKINPSKMDEIMESYPDIKEAACFGLLSDKGDISLCAVYVTKQLEFNLEKFEEYLIKQVNNLSMSLVIVPKIFVKVDKIIRNSNGKIMRHELSKKYKLSATNQLLELKIS